MELRSTSRATAHRRGFTLVELLIVVAIIGILAAVALPNYSEHVRRSRLSDGLAQLAELRVRLEQYYQDQRSYGTATCADVSSPAWAAFPISRDNFTISCALLAAGQQFRLTASGSGRVAGFTYTIDDAGARATTQFAGAAVALNCWATRDAGSCDN